MLRSAVAQNPVREQAPGEPSSWSLRTHRWASPAATFGLLVASLLAACGGGDPEPAAAGADAGRVGDGGSDAASGHRDAGPREGGFTDGGAPDAGRGDGGPEGRIADAIETTDVGDSWEVGEVSTDAQGRPLLRTKLEIAFHPDTPMGEVNALLERHRARVTTSLAGVPSVVVRIPDPGDLEALDLLVTELEAEAVVWQVVRAYFEQPRALPANAAPASGGWPELHHHLAVRGAPAWNLRAAIRSVPNVVVPDLFGWGTPGDALDADLVEDQWGMYSEAQLAARGFRIVGPRRPPDPSASLLPNHGYHVVGIIAGRFGGPQTPLGRVTGMFPGRSKLDVSNSMERGPLDTRMAALQLAVAAEGTVVLSTSLGWGGCEGRAECHPHARHLGSLFALKVRRIGLAERMLLLAAGGNNDGSVPTPTLMETSSGVIAAGRRDDLADEDGNPIDPLGNVLAIVATHTTDEAGVPAVECVNVGSFTGGDLSAVGVDVYSLYNPTGTGLWSGTSMAAPQAAGLAAYLSSVRPELSGLELKELLMVTSMPVASSDDPACAQTDTPAPSIDAYAAMLALDRDGDQPVRRALFDWDEDGDFDANDLEPTVQALDRAGGAIDFGRADFNGDGRTGGDRVDFFPMTVGSRRGDGSYVTRDVDGERQLFFSDAATDRAVLCAHAWSAPYTGSAVDSWLPREDCQPNVPEVDGPTARFDHAPFPITIRAGQQRVPGVTTWLPGLQVEVSLSGASGPTTSIATDEDGSVDVMVSPQAASELIEWVVTVRDPTGEHVLSQQNGTIPVGGGAQVTVVSWVQDALAQAEVSIPGVETDSNTQSLMEDISTSTPGTLPASAMASLSRSDPSASGTASSSASSTLSISGALLPEFVLDASVMAMASMTQVDASFPGDAVNYNARGEPRSMAQARFSVEGGNVTYALQARVSPDPLCASRALLHDSGANVIVEDLQPTDGASEALEAAGILAEGTYLIVVRTCALAYAQGVDQPSSSSTAQAQATLRLGAAP